jgi:hypothetical protein
VALFVKHLRIWLLVILAVLLPLRGAMAVAMSCAPSGAGTKSELRSMDHDAAGHDHTGSAHEAVQHEHGAAPHDHEEANQDKCNLCSASCSATPLVSAIAGIQEPGDLASASFPGFSAPAPSFVSDGQERPPRSI